MEVVECFQPETRYYMNVLSKFTKKIQEIH